jgi:ribonucleoside-diphosphate reductase beta chain
MKSLAAVNLAPAQSKETTMTIFNENKVDHLTQPMFFGESLNIARYETMKYPKFDDLAEAQKGFFWNPQEIDLTKDRQDFLKLPDHQQRLFLLNLKYQSLMDSVQGRAPSIAFLPYVSIPELEICIQTWSFFETIHSKAYTHIVRNVVKDPSKVFDEIMDDETILARAKVVTADYNDFIDYAQRYQMFGYGTHNIITNGETLTVTISKKELYRKLYRALIAVYILEGIRFYVSFACSFAFGERGVMIGNTEEISLIARDEAQHLAVTLLILKNYKNKENDNLMTYIMAEEEEHVYEMFKEAVELEKAWATYLFKDGPMIGLNAQMLCEYIEYIANVRLKNLGLKQIFASKTNPLPWTMKYLDSSNKQTAPQENELTSYVIGKIDPRVDISSLSKKYADLI